jgi:myo-inositol 2-dehydrogenase / D-chiro-inositol 1-dehydrogenase
MPTRLQVAIAGLGRLGRRHAENLARRLPQAELVAACSPLNEELQWASGTLGIKHVYPDYDQLLRHPQLDAVFLVTPTTLHAAQIVQALRAGKHVFCEKPLALNLADCHAVEQEAAKHPQLKVLIGFVRRFDRSYRDAYQKIRGGAIGKPFLVRSQTCDQNDPSGFFVRFAPTSGGIFLDASIHDIDLARWLLGSPKPTRVFATGTIAIHQGLAPFGDVDNGVAICEFADGKIAYFYASRTMAHGHETVTEIVGTQGRIAVGQNPRLNRVEIADHHGMRNEVTPSFYERFEEAFLVEVEEFVQDVLLDRTPILRLHDATEATRIGIAITDSLRSKQVVQL